MIDEKPDAVVSAEECYRREDYVEAVRWYRVAADQGHFRSQYELGSMYADGRGVQQSNVNAYMWLKLSNRQALSPQPHRPYRRLFDESGETMDRLDISKVIEAHDRIAAGLTPDQLAEGQRLALEWDAAHPPD